MAVQRIIPGRIKYHCKNNWPWPTHILSAMLRHTRKGPSQSGKPNFQPRNGKESVLTGLRDKH